MFVPKCHNERHPAYPANLVQKQNVTSLTHQARSFSRRSQLGQTQLAAFFLSATFDPISAKLAACPNNEISTSLPAFVPLLYEARVSQAGHSRLGTGHVRHAGNRDKNGQGLEDRGEDEQENKTALSLLVKGVNICFFIITVSPRTQTPCRVITPQTERRFMTVGYVVTDQSQ